MIQLPAHLVTSYLAYCSRCGIRGAEHADCLKWILYFFDYCEKYQVTGEDVERIRLFLDKLKEKKQNEDQRRHAYQAISLYFRMLKENGSTQQPAAGSLPSTERQKSPDDGAHLPPFICYPPLAGQLRHPYDPDQARSSSLKTTMIYTHCVPVRTMKEAKSPLDF